MKLNGIRITCRVIILYFCGRIVLMMDREERSVISNCAVNQWTQNCALRMATAFSKGKHILGNEFYALA